MGHAGGDATVMDDLVCISLKNGSKLPNLGYAVPTRGTEDIARCLQTALRAGFRHIMADSRDINDEEVGQVIQRTHARNIPREDVFVSTKMVVADPKRVNVKSRFVQRLYTLGCDYIDMLLLEMPDITKQPTSPLVRPARNLADSEEDALTKIWKLAESLRDEGYVRVLGITCQNDKMIDILLKRPQITPQVLLVNYKTIMASPKLSRFVQFCRLRDIHLVVEITDAYEDSSSSSRLESVLTDTAKKLGKNRDQVLIRSFVERGLPVVFHSPNLRSIPTSFQVYDFKLNREDLIRISRTAATSD